MRWTRLSFAYLITYLGAGGLALLMAPSSALHLLGATGAYPAPLARFLGGFMVAFAILVAGIVRHRAEVLYPVTLLVRGSSWPSWSGSTWIPGIPYLSCSPPWWGSEWGSPPWGF